MCRDFSVSSQYQTPWWYLCLAVVVGPTWSNDFMQYAESSLANGRVSQASQVKSGVQTKRETLVIQAGGWALGWHPNPIKINLLENNTIVQLNVECVKLLQPMKITENELEIRDLRGWRGVQDDRNKKLTGSAQRSKQIQEDYIRSQGPK